MFFTASTDCTGTELGVSDGTPAGTRLVKDIKPFEGSSSPQAMTPFGDALLFLADDGVHGVELWRSDGTEAGTAMVRDIYPGPVAGVASFTQGSIAVLDGIAYFSGRTPVAGRELCPGVPTARSCCVPSRPGQRQAGRRAAATRYSIAASKPHPDLPHREERGQVHFRFAGT